MKEQWQELKETIIEMRDNNGTGTQEDTCKYLVDYMDVLEKQIQEPKTGQFAENLCDSCTNRSCEFQSGIQRSKCDFYIPPIPHLEPDNCGNYVVQVKTVTNAEEAEEYQISEDISKGFEEFTKTMFKQGREESKETVTEFADRCRECGAKYGKLLKKGSCGDTISRQAVLDVWHTSYSDNREENEEIQYKKIAFELPSVKPQEPKTDVLDKIRAEIVEDIEMYNDIFEDDCSGLRMALDIIDKYKTESEEQE